MAGWPTKSYSSGVLTSRTITLSLAPSYMAKASRAVTYLPMRVCFFASAGTSAARALRLVEHTNNASAMQQNFFKASSESVGSGAPGAWPARRRRTRPLTGRAFLA